MISYNKHILLSATLALLAHSPALALDADAFMERLTASMVNNGVKLEYASAELDGTSIIVEDAKLVTPDTPIPLGKISFSNVMEDGQGGFRVEMATVEDIIVENDDMNFSLVGIEIGGLRIPSKDAEDPVDAFLLYENFKTGPATFNLVGTDVLKLSGSHFNLSYGNDNQNISFDGLVDGIRIDLSLLRNRMAKAAITQMGYDVLNGDLKINGDWDLNTGLMNIPEYALTLNDVGRLNIGLDISGYTAEFLERAQEINKQMSAKAEHADAQQVLNMASLDLLQQLNLNSASIRFDDASLTSKVLTFIGTQQGMSAEQMAQAAKGILPFALARLGMPELQQQIAAAVSTYLDDPKSFEIKAAPETPVSFGQIMGASMAAPQSIPALIGVEVIANQ